MKSKYEKNIQVNVNYTDEDGNKKRTTTTLNYGICRYLFCDVLHPEQSNKALNDKRCKDPRTRHRKWLETVTQEYVREYLKCDSSNSNVIEQELLNEIFNRGYRAGLEKNKDNHGLDV